MGSERREQEALIPLEIGVTANEYERTLKAMAAMGVPIPADNSTNIYLNAANVGLSLFLTLQNRNCLNSQGSIGWKPESHFSYKRLPVANLLQSSTASLGQAPDHSIPFTISYNAAAGCDGLISSSKYFLKENGIPLTNDSKQNYTTLYRTSALAITNIVESTQRSGRADLPIKISFGNNNTVYGDEYAYQYTGIQLYRGAIEKTPKGIKKLARKLSK